MKKWFYPARLKSLQNRFGICTISAPAILKLLCIVLPKFMEFSDTSAATSLLRDIVVDVTQLVLLLRLCSFTAR